MPESRPLTSANWTPDVVASILGTLIGALIGLFYLFLASFAGEGPVIAFALLIALLVAYAFNRIVFHMELEGRRHFQQAFSLMIPATTITYFVLLVRQAAVVAVKNKVAALNPMNAITGAQPALAQVTVPTFQAPLLLTSLLALAILLPFLIHALKEKQFRPWWLLYVLIPFVICGLMYLVATSIMSIFAF